MAERDLEGNPIFDLARGDAALSRELRDGLQRLSNHSDNAEFKDLVDDVLNGRRSLREAAREGLFTSEMTVDTRRLNADFDAVTGDLGQTVVEPEVMERLSGLRAEARQKMAEIEKQTRELERLQRDIEAEPGPFAGG
ncbi:hypothetical protein ACFQ07_31475 [Actinomadura adrarensis]|uniref:Uncharacterized protein n=1 Tax=Actinomadura adrarensis TaxID=1819600 RepID=A0ABW3CRD2_9ACTN